jgi:hypothetical protein
MKKLLFLLFVISGLNLSAQVAINSDGTAPDNSAMLDVKSTTAGMLVPRMTTIQRNAIASPAPGLLVFCTDNNFYYSNQGTAISPNWVMINSKWSPVGLGISYTGGNVGIGTTAPGYNLDVEGLSTYVYVKGTGGTANLILDKANTNDNSLMVCERAYIPTWGIGTLGSDNFTIYNSGISSEALGINQTNNYASFSGRIGIKTYPNYDLHVNSTDFTAAFITTNSDGGTAMDVEATGAAFAWGIYAYGPLTGYAGYFSGSIYCTGNYLPSDERLKENIQPMQDALGKIMKLDVKTYTFNQEFARMNLPTSRQYGFTAQNLEGVFPELVKLNPAKGKEQPIEFKAVNYTGMIPILTQAIQEQQKQLEAKNARIDSLQKQLDDLKILVLNIQQNQKHVPEKD